MGKHQCQHRASPPSGRNGRNSQTIALAANLSKPQVEGDLDLPGVLLKRQRGWEGRGNGNAPNGRGAEAVYEDGIRVIQVGVVQDIVEVDAQNQAGRFRKPANGKRAAHTEI